MATLCWGKQEQRRFRFLGTLILANTCPLEIGEIGWASLVQKEGSRAWLLGMWGPSSHVPLLQPRTPTCCVPDLEVQGFALHLQINGEPLKHSGGVALRKKGARRRL